MVITQKQRPYNRIGQISFLIIFYTTRMSYVTLYMQSGNKKETDFFVANNFFKTKLIIIGKTTV